MNVPNPLRRSGVVRLAFACRLLIPPTATWLGARCEFTKSFGLLPAGRNALNPGKTRYFKDANGPDQRTAGVSGRF